MIHRYKKAVFIARDSVVPIHGLASEIGISFAKFHEVIGEDRVTEGEFLPYMKDGSNHGLQVFDSIAVRTPDGWVSSYSPSGARFSAHWTKAHRFTSPTMAKGCVTYLDRRGFKSEMVKA